MINSYNEAIKEQIDAGSWNKEASKVTYCDVTAGFNPKSMTKDLLHPNAQGALIVAGNIARFLGVDQRAVGKERVASSNLSSQMKFSTNATGASGKDFPTDGEVADVNFWGTTAETWRINDPGNLVITTNTNASDIRYVYSDSTSAHEFTLSLDVKMLTAQDYGKNNVLGVFCGNGVDVGILYVSESGISWGGNSLLLLYQNYELDKIFMEGFSTLRMAWIAADAANGITGGYYVWLGDQLIGEALGGNTTTAVFDKYKNSILIGDIGGVIILLMPKSRIFRSMLKGRMHLPFRNRLRLVCSRA